jgi:GntR family transcriptional regulator
MIIHVLMNLNALPIFTQKRFRYSELRQSRMELRKNIPMHEQISRWLREQIADKSYANDEKLPSEQELSDRFGVSRVTVRRALQTLENEQLIYRCQGLGSFVKTVKATPEMIRLTDFMEDMRQAGKEARSVVTSSTQVPACGFTAPRLGVKEGQMVLKLDRLRLGDDEPVAFDITWFPAFYGQLLVDHDLSVKTIYSVLEEEYDIPVIRGSYEIQASTADAETAEHLRISEGAPLLVFDRLSLTLHDKPVYFQRRYYRPDKVSWRVSLERNPKNAGEQPLREFLPVFR